MFVGTKFSLQMCFYLSYTHHLFEFSLIIVSVGRRNNLNHFPQCIQRHLVIRCENHIKNCRLKHKKGENKFIAENLIQSKDDAEFFRFEFNVCFQQIFLKFILDIYSFHVIGCFTCIIDSLFQWIDMKNHNSTEI